MNVRIDKLTASIENAFTKEVFKTDVALVSKEDIELLDPDNWLFDWSKELKSASFSNL